MRLHRIVRVYTCQKATLLEITCHGSYSVGTQNNRLIVKLLMSTKTYVKAAYSVTMNIFRKKKILFKSFAKVE